MRAIPHLALLLPVAALAVAPPPYELVSRRHATVPDTSTGQGASQAPFFSADGTWLYFTSDMAGPGLEAAGGGTPDAFRRHLASGTLELLSPRLPHAAVDHLGLLLTAASTNDQFVLLEGGAVLTPGDTNSTGDVFVRDLAAGVTHLVSVNTAGDGAGNGASGDAFMSPDGRLVLFGSLATDLVSDDANNAQDVFLRDRQTGLTTLLSRGARGQTAANASPVLLANDAQTAVFACYTTNLAAPPPDTVPTDLHIWTAGGLVQVGLPRPSVGRLSRADSFPTTTAHVQSDDGRVLCFISEAYMWLGQGVTGRIPPAAWRLDLDSGQLVKLVEEAPLGAQSPGAIRFLGRLHPSADASRVALDMMVVPPAGVTGLDAVRIWDNGTLRTLDELVLTVPPGGAPAPTSLGDSVLSPDGQRLAFVSLEPGVVPGAPGGEWELYLRDLATGQTRALSAPGGVFHGGVEDPQPAFNAAGDRMAFVTTADGLAPGDANQAGDIFIADTADGSLQLVSAWPAAAGLRTPAGLSSFSQQAISSDGQRILFTSTSHDVAAGDTNGTWDGFVFDRPGGRVLLVSANTNGVPASKPATMEQLSADGRLVLFLSAAPDLAPGDTNGATDVFMRDLETGVTELLSRSPLTGRTPGGGVVGALASGNGRTVIYTTRDRNHLPGAAAGPQPYYVLHDRVSGSHALIGSSFGGTATIALSGDGATAIAARAGGTVKASAADGWIWHPFALPDTTPLGAPEIVLNEDGSMLAVATSARTLVLTNFATGRSLTVSPAGSSLSGFIDLRFTPSGRHLLARGPGLTGEPNRPWHWVAFETGETRILNERPGRPLLEMSDARMDDSGRRIVFRSVDDDLVPGDVNGVMDVFLLELETGAITLLSRRPDGRSADGFSLTPAISGDGRWVAFQSTAALVPGDGNGWPDVYLAPLDPLLPLLPLRLMGARRHADGTLRLPWRGPGGPAHRLLGAEAVEGPWLPLGGEVPAGTTAGEFTVPVDGAAKRFFKVEER